MHAHAFESYSNDKLVNFYVATSVRHYNNKINIFMLIACYRLIQWNHITSFA